MVPHRNDLSRLARRDQPPACLGQGPDGLRVLAAAAARVTPPTPVQPAG
jgi:hypothetical protein